MLQTDKDDSLLICFTAQKGKQNKPKIMHPSEVSRAQTMQSSADMLPRLAFG